jgi:hypothetical protein
MIVQALGYLQLGHAPKDQPQQQSPESSMPLVARFLRRLQINQESTQNQPISWVFR